MIKPYRFIGAKELQHLKNKLMDIINSWSSEYSKNSLEFELTIISDRYSITNALLIKNNNNPKALVQANYLSFISELVFGSDHAEFASCSKELFSRLIRSLFDNSQSIERSEYCLDDWMYPGSTSLLLSLKNHPHTLDILLHPLWVYQHLDRPATRHLKKIDVEEVLAPEVLHLNVELDSIALSLTQILELNIGDVLVTDHLIQAPVIITHDKQRLGDAHLGRYLDNKSIGPVDSNMKPWVPLPDGRGSDSS